MKLKPVPWDDSGIAHRARAYTHKQLAAKARSTAASYEDTRLLDWRLLVKNGTCTLQIRYLLADGIDRYHNIAL